MRGKGFSRGAAGRGAAGRAAGGRALAITAVLLGAAAAGLRRPHSAGAADSETSEEAIAFEIGPGLEQELPRGKEADGILGDYVIRNRWIDALVSGNLPNRRANMTTHYQAPTPGCLYDLSVRGSSNDQLTCLAPGELEGAVSSVKVGSVGGIGQSPLSAEGPVASIVVERTAARGQGVAVTHEYRLVPEWRHLLIVSRWQNHSKKPAKVTLAPLWKGLSGEVFARGIRAAEAMDPMDRQGYATAALPWPATVVKERGRLAAALDQDTFTLEPGERQEIAVAVAPARSPAEAFGVIAALRGPTGVLKGEVRGPRGRPVPTALVEVPIDGKVLRAYPSAEGAFQLRLPPGDYELTARDLGRPEAKRRVAVAAGAEVEARFDLEEEARLAFEVVGPNDVKTPCKAQIIGIGGTPDPDLGPTIRAHGCRNQYHSETGWFTVPVPPGKYRVVVTRGIEYDHRAVEVEVKAGRETRVEAVIQRVIDTRGWVSTDFHNHSTPSGDNYCGTDDRLINLAAEGVEFAPTTEHNRFFDWAPHIRRLGLADELKTVVGIELTGRGPHLNAFPFRPFPYLQDGGAPVWSPDPRINALVLRDFDGGGSDRWVQINHPAVGEYFRDRDGDGVADGGFTGLERLLDAAEVWSAEILSFSPIVTDVDRTTGRIRRLQNRTFAWLQLLNQGRRMWCVAVSDAHEVFNGGVGGWRTYVPSSTDSPSEIDYREIVRNARDGRMVITNGPYLEASLADGTLPGDTRVLAGTARLRVRVQCNTWVDIDRVQVLVNGRARPELNFTRKTHPAMFRDRPSGRVRFEETIDVPLTEDSWLIAVAYGQDQDLSTGYGSSAQSRLHPCAFHNPIFLDVDGDGFRSNGDTLGHPLPVTFPIRRSY